jgi:hypothetical protein
MPDPEAPPNPVDWLSDLVTTDGLMTQQPEFLTWCRYGSLDEVVPLAVEECWRRLKKLH